LRTLLTTVPLGAALADSAVVAATSTAMGKAATAVEAISAKVGRGAADVKAAAVVGAVATAIALVCTTPARDSAGVAEKCGWRRAPTRRQAKTCAGGPTGRWISAVAKATPAGAVPVTGAVTQANPLGAEEGPIGGRLVDAAGVSRDSSDASSASLMI